MIGRLVPSAPHPWKTGKVLPRIWGLRCFFRGWSSDLAHFWPRTFRFAAHYREVRGAAAKREAYSMRLPPRKQAGSVRLRRYSIMVLPMSGAAGTGMQVCTATITTTPVLLFWTAQRPVFSSSQEEKMGGWPRGGAACPRAVRRRRHSQISSPYSAQVLLSVIFTSTNCPIKLLPPLSRTSRLPSVRDARGYIGSSLSPSTSTRTVWPI